MPIFQRPTLECLSRAEDRWTPIYLEHGRLEVDDSALKWIGSDGMIFPIPAAVVSAILLGPGTTVTHDAVKAAEESNLILCWVGENSMRFYACGMSSTSSSDNARKQAEAYVNIQRRESIARKMFLKRFPEIDVSTKSIDELRLLEGRRVKDMYADLGYRHGVTWKGRNYTPGCFHLSDEVNCAISATNHSLYALCLSIICSMGYLPQLGFIHLAGTNSFVFDIADMYKPELTLEASFKAAGIRSGSILETALDNMKEVIEKGGYMKKIPKDINRLFE